MTPKQTLFVAEYLANGLNATKAAISAGYSEKTANKTGPRMLVNAGIAAAIAKKTGKRLAKLEVTADYVLTTIVSTIERCSQSEQVMFRGVPVEGVYMFDPTNVLKGAELLGKYLKMFTERVEVDSNHDFEVQDIKQKLLAKLNCRIALALKS
jgi:phage terminase small subunit